MGKKNNLFPATLHEAVFDIHRIFHERGFWIFLIHCHVLFSCYAMFHVQGLWDLVFLMFPGSL